MPIENRFAHIDSSLKIKAQFIKVYMLLTMSALLFFSVVFQFFIINKTVSFYLLSGFIIFLFFYIFSTYKYHPDKYLLGHLITGPLFNIYILVAFWENSIGSFVSLFPVIIAAHLFFNRKTTFVFIVYIFFILLVSYIIHSNELIPSPHYNRNEVIFSDTVLFSYNIAVLLLLFLCKEKLDKSRPGGIQATDEKEKVEIKEKKEKDQPLQSSEQQLNDEEANKLIIDLRRLMENEKLFCNSDIEISKISLKLGINYSYLSRVIRYKGFNNFNHYINTYRIRYVKKLLHESDLEKVTLMYIYTEAGFKNQSTFNRAFKQIEGVTPSEYIKRKKNSEQTE